VRTADFFNFARARHQIYLDRQAGRPEPWTLDPVLATYRFTNVFRELDRTTIWFRANVRQYLTHAPGWGQLLGTILFRTFNRIETAEVIFNQERLGEYRPTGWAYLEEDITAPELEAYMRAHCPAPWVTGSYIVKTPDGMDKLCGALWIVEEARKRIPDTLAKAPAQMSLEWLHRALQSYPFIGGFTGYEIVSDLRHLPLLLRAPDTMTWAHAGPGAVRGLNRLLGVPVGDSRPQASSLHHMRALLAASRGDGPDHIRYWPFEWPAWEMREVEHTLCEFDKYERARLGEGRPRGRFR
jgi:hypothetical protein